MDKYFNSGTNEVCSACHRKCLTCVTSNSNCLTCGANRLTAPSCACQNQFYDDGFSTSCQPCHYSCKTCTSSNSCTSCDQTTAFRGLSTTSSYCVCLSRYYDTNTLICSPCHNTCFECTNGLATSCTSCSSLANRQLSGSTCACKTGFF
jgi:proprotein convertase subtilisin/kexin type 5